MPEPSQAAEAAEAASRPPVSPLSRRDQQTARAKPRRAATDADGAGTGERSASAAIEERVTPRRARPRDNRVARGGPTGGPTFRLNTYRVYDLPDGRQVAVRIDSRPADPRIVARYGGRRVLVESRHFYDGGWWD